MDSTHRRVEVVPGESIRSRPTRYWWFLLAGQVVVMLVWVGVLVFSDPAWLNWLFLLLSLPGWVLPFQQLRTWGIDREGIVLPGRRKVIPWSQVVDVVPGDRLGCRTHLRLCDGKEVATGFAVGLLEEVLAIRRVAMAGQDGPGGIFDTEVNGGAP